MNRRQFLIRQAGLTGLGAAAPFSSWMSLQALSDAAAQGAGGPETGYRALVCVFLAGGNDSFNMLMPAPGTDASGNWGGPLLHRFRRPMLRERRPGTATAASARG